MPYKAKGKCVYRKDTGKKVGCTKGSVKKYLAALHANVKDVNESEDSLNWADNINIMLGFDDLEVGNLVKLKDYDNNVWQVTEIYMTNPAMTGKPSEKRIKFKSLSKNSYLELWKSPLNSSEYFELMSDRFNIMKESEDDLNWADDANLTPIKDDEERYKLIFDTLSKIKYKNYSVYQDKFDGVVYWNGLPGGYTGMATPEWENPFEVPIDVMWNQGNDYDNVGIIKTPKFKYVEELVEWYSKDYFEKVSKTLENFIEFGDTPGIIESHINESEFDWLETPELPEDNDFISSVKYALEGSPYELIEKGNLFDSKFTMVVLHKKVSQLGNSTGDSLVIKKRENFTPKNVKFEFDNVFNNLKNQEKLLGPGGISHNPRTFPDLFSKIEKLRTLYFGAYELIKDLLPKDGINESEEQFDWVDFGDTDKINEFYQKVRELLQDTDYEIREHLTNDKQNIIFKIYFRDQIVDAWSEKFFKPEIVEEDLYSQYEHFEEGDMDSEIITNLYKLLRPAWTKDINESEFNKKITPSSEVIKDVCQKEKFCKAQGPITFGQLKYLIESSKNKRLFYNITEGGYKALIRLLPWFIPQIAIAGFFGSSLRAFNKIIKPTIEETSNYKTWWGKVVLKVMQLSEGDLPKYDPISKIFFVSDGLLHMMDEKVKLKFTKYISDLAASMPENEPVPEFFVENELRKFLNEKFLLNPPLGPKTMNESEDFGDLNWADEINPLDFSYQGKEFFFDIREINREELGKLYNLLLPHMNKTGKFINHMGEEISWNNNTTCFQNLISTSSRGTITSISLHCGINDNDYLPLEGAICCLSGTYENEPDKSNIIYINAKDLFDYTINESEWFEDVANEPIVLKTEDLEIGDIVTSTCFKEEEFVVTGKGTSVKLLHEPTHWVTLRRNTKTDMGGVFLEHDTEMGRNCRFTLVHRENLIEESEENDDLFWADEMLKSYDDSIDITGDSEQLSNLKPGDFLKITGYQDNLDIDNDCKIVDFGVKSGRSPKYLVKFKKEIRTDDGSDVTHCGPYDRETGGRIEKDCDCRRATPDDEPHSSDTVGKCWFVDLNHMDKVLWYPNRHGLVENKKIEKPLLIEGRYDTITRKVVKDIINFVTSKRKGSFSLPYDMTDEFEYEQEGLSFSIDLDIKKNRGVKDFYLDAAVSDDKDENVIMVALFFGPDFSPKSYEKLFYRLQEVMRHEIEHLTQGGPNRIPDRPIYYGSTSDLKTVYGHHKNKIEVPALVHGFYRRAKIEKRPLDEIMIEDLDADIQKGFLSKKQAENLLTIWLDYAKKNIPAAIYSKD